MLDDSTRSGRLISEHDKQRESRFLLLNSWNVYKWCIQSACLSKWRSNAIPVLLKGIPKVSMIFFNFLSMIFRIPNNCFESTALRMLIVPFFSTLETCFPSVIRNTPIRIIKRFKVFIFSDLFCPQLKLKPETVQGLVKSSSDLFCCSHILRLQYTCAGSTVSIFISSDWPGIRSQIYLCRALISRDW